jgi:hypothetical protein
MKKIFYILILLVYSFKSIAQAPGNDNCASATTLTSGAAPLCAQTTNNGTTQGGEVIASGSVGAANNFNQTVWYKFVATSANMYVEWEFTGLVSGATWCSGNASMVVYNTASCIPAAGSIIATQSSAADGAIVINLTGLTIGNTYLVQVGYNDGAGCKVPIFCMQVGNTPTNCSCASPCAAGCGYATTPSVATVTSTCPAYDLNPVGDGGTTNTYCYSFTANNTTVSFSMIITSNCSGGNVSALTWTLQTAACGANVASGNLSSMSASGLTIGTQYVLCYTYTIPSTCHHSSLYPYFVGASPLPIELISFDVQKNENVVIANWITVTEHNNDYFTLEKSKDGVNWELVSVIDGAGNSTSVLNYSKTDSKPYHGTSYYRLKQTDYDGHSTTSAIKSVFFAEDVDLDFDIVPNPSNQDGGFALNFNTVADELDFGLLIMDLTGKVVYQKTVKSVDSKININEILAKGMYVLQLKNADKTFTKKLIVK